MGHETTLKTVKLAVIGALAMGFLGCSTMRSEIDIQASPQHVWRVLTDIESYPEWNPFFVKARGDLHEGRSLDLVMQPVGKSQQSFSPTILQIDPERQLVWRGRLWIPMLFDGTHHFIVEPRAGGGSHFVQYEDFSGIFVPFVGFEPFRQGWEKMNASLKKRAEEHERANPPAHVAASP
ncbi:MAG: SRPBCC domain-containing protein [Polyangiaceae bacterium]|jgi:hypothetical protein